MKDLGVPTVRGAHTKHATIKVRYPRRWGWWVGASVAALCILVPLILAGYRMSESAALTKPTAACRK